MRDAEREDLNDTERREPNVRRLAADLVEHIRGRTPANPTQGRPCEIGRVQAGDAMGG
jgi:hypothetical protein